MFSECTIFSSENILRKGKHFLLFDCVVEIMPKNYFLCLVLHVKNLFLEKVNISQPPATTDKDKQNPPPTIQNPDQEKEKNCHHCFVATKFHQNTTTHTIATTTKSEIKEKEDQPQK